jgi:Flp pilus assembly pilin Flp
MLDALNLLVVRSLSRLRREEGQTMTEYALVLALLAAAAAGIFLLLTDGLTTKFTNIVDAINP